MAGSEMPNLEPMAVRSSTAASESSPASMRGRLASTGMPITSDARPARTQTFSPQQYMPCMRPLCTVRKAQTD